MKALFGILLVMGMLFSIANVTTEGGNVTEVALNMSQNSTYWDGIYGEVILGTGINSTKVVIGNNISRLNMIGQEPPCAEYTTTMHIMSANTTNIVLPLTAGNLTILDEMISGEDNGSSTFTESGTYRVTYGTITNVPSLHTLAGGSPSPYFREGYLNDAENNLVFVADIVNNRLDWENGTSDYQMILPNNGSPMQYLVWTDIEYSCTKPTKPGHKNHELFIQPITEQKIRIKDTLNLKTIVENTGDYSEWGIAVYLLGAPSGIIYNQINITELSEGEEKKVVLPITAQTIGSKLITICAKSEDTRYCREFILNVMAECTNASECGETEYCNEGICDVQKENGETCASDSECLSALCVEGKCVFCKTNNDCGAVEECVEGKCEKIECPCGEIVSHHCETYECCADMDCTNEEYCIKSKCVEKELEIVLIDGEKIEGETGLFQIVNNKGEKIGHAKVFSDEEETVSDNFGYASIIFPYNGIIYAYAEGYKQIARIYAVTKLGIITVKKVSLLGNTTTIRVEDIRGNAIPGAVLTIEGKEYLTDKNGEVEHIFNSLGKKEISATKGGYLIQNTEILVELASPKITEEVCNFPIILNLIELGKGGSGGLGVLWITSVVLGISNFLILRRRMKKNFLEKMVGTSDKHKEILQSREMGEIAKNFAYSFGPIILAIPNVWILSICFMANVILVQTIAEIILVVRTLRH